MQLRLISFLGTALVLLLQQPANARIWKMLAECHFISADGKQQIDDVCQIEGSSGQGLEEFTISWKDGVKTKVSGRFVTRKNYQVDGKPPVMKRMNDVTVLRTYSGNVITLRKIRNLQP